MCVCVCVCVCVYACVNIGSPEDLVLFYFITEIYSAYLYVEQYFLPIKISIKF